MMKKLLSLSLLFIIYSKSFSQLPKLIKYRDVIYETSIQKDISYYTTGKTDQRYYKADLYQPIDSSNEKRPLIIWLHGGGFKYGNKKSGGIPLWCKEFAGRGYVCAAINYRLSKKKPLRRFPDLVEGCLQATEDLQKSIDFFKRNANQYRIDTNHIIAGGNSAGGMIALQSVYSSPNKMMELINRPGSDTLSKANNSAGLCAIINFWGALFNKEWLNNEKVPIVSAHGSKDKIVAINSRGPLNGSNAIHQYADTLGIPNALKVFQGFGHELQLHFNPFFVGRKTKKRWKQAGDFAAVFLYEHFFRK